MRLIAACAFALLLAACQPPAQTADNEAGACTRTATKQIAWTGTEATDTVTARAEGPSCAQAVVTLTVRNANGDPLWTFASTYYDMTVGGRTDQAPAVSPEEVDSFLAGWVDVTLNHSGDLPAWAPDADTLSAANDGVSYFTELDRDMYEGLRARNLPQLCYAAAVEASQCLVMDPISQAPIMLVSYGV